MSLYLSNTGIIDLWIVIIPSFLALVGGIISSYFSFKSSSTVKKVREENINGHEKIENNATSLKEVQEILETSMKDIKLWVEKLIENSSQEQRARWRTFMSISPYMFFETDYNGDCVYVNNSWTKTTGIFFKEALGDGWLNAISLKEKTNVLIAWNYAVEHKAPFGPIKFHFVKNTKDLIFVEACAYPYFDSNNVVLGYIGFITEVEN